MKTRAAAGNMVLDLRMVRLLLLSATSAFNSLRPSLAAFCLPLLLASCLPGLAQAPPHYSVTNLCGKLLPSSTSAYAINDKTEVVGVLNGHPFLWCEGKLQVLDFSGFARAINNRSQVIGVIDLQPGSEVKAWEPFERGFLYQDGTLHKMEALPGGVFSSNARAINVSGEIVGYSSTGGYGHATLYKNNQLTDLGVPHGFDSSAGLGINSSGQIVGYVKRMTPYTKAAFLWENGHWKLLFANIYPVAINDSGSVLSYKSLSNAKHDGTITTCFLWKHRAQESIGSFRPTAMNNSEQVVGNTIPDWSTHLRPFLSHPKTLSAVAVLWQSGHLWRLNSLIPKNQGWQIISAEGINNRGEIVGSGLHHGKVCAMLLRPIIR